MWSDRKSLSRFSSYLLIISTLSPKVLQLWHPQQQLNWLVFVVWINNTTGQEHNLSYKNLEMGDACKQPFKSCSCWFESSKGFGTSIYLLNPLLTLKFCIEPINTEGVRRTHLSLKLPNLCSLRHSWKSSFPFLYSPLLLLACLSSHYSPWPLWTDCIRFYSLLFPASGIIPDS